jgi:hypothetical protein
MTIEQYIEDRDRPEHAFITGTQLSVCAVQARLDAGETVMTSQSTTQMSREMHFMLREIIGGSGGSSWKHHSAMTQLCADVSCYLSRGSIQRIRRCFTRSL